MKIQKAMENLISQPENSFKKTHIPAVNNTPKYVREVAPATEKVHSFSLQRYK